MRVKLSLPQKFSLHHLVMRHLENFLQQKAISDFKLNTPDGSEICTLFSMYIFTTSQVPANTFPDNYTLRLEGQEVQGRAGFIFENETKLEFGTKQLSVYIQTSKPLYRQGQRGNIFKCLSMGMH